jgi:hypothetical protein
MTDRARHAGTSARQSAGRAQVHVQRAVDLLDVNVSERPEAAAPFATTRRCGGRTPAPRPARVAEIGDQRLDAVDVARQLVGTSAPAPGDHRRREAASHDRATDPGRAGHEHRACL